MDGVAFAGSGLLIANPPYGIEPRLKALGRDLAAAFDAPRARLDVDWWIARDLISDQREAGGVEGRQAARREGREVDRRPTRRRGSARPAPRRWRAR